MVFDARTGEVRDDKKYMSFVEDFWLPRRDNGRGTEITTLPGAANLQSQLDIIEYFQKKLYQALNIPLSRLQGDQTVFGLGRASEITRDELKFQKFINRLRIKFSQLFYEALRIQLILRGICNSEEWEKLKQSIRFRFQSDNYFSELKNQDILQSRLQFLPQVDQYLGKYFSKEWVQKNILRMTDADIQEMEEQIENEKNDPTAQPLGMEAMPQENVVIVSEAHENNEEYATPEQYPFPQK